MLIKREVQLGTLTTFRVGGTARFFAEAQTEAEVREAWLYSRERQVPLHILGGGSNLLVPDQGVDGLVLRIAIGGIDRCGDVFDVGGGESWDRLVQVAVDADCAGMECLAGIPGTTGASPVQNIGAYGQEIAQTLDSVRALDRSTGEWREFTNADCQFRYRKSLFNDAERGRYIITRVRFRLRPGGEPALAYADLQRWFAARTTEPTLREVATAVRSIRAAKGMVLIEGDPDTCSAGSYFKNPIMPSARLKSVAEAAAIDVGKVPHWPAGPGCTKFSAAWLLERSGFGRGFQVGRAGLSTKHALALTNRGGATCAELLRLERTIRDGVFARFGVELEREPVLFGAEA